MIDVQVVATAWLIASGLCAIWLLVDLRRQPAIMGMMKVAWVLITLYLGPIGVWLYITSCREPAPGTHDEFVAPMWKQATGSVMHCVAGDALGIVAAAVVTSRLGLGMTQDMGIEYIAGFLVGWLLFQTIPMARMNRTSFREEVKAGFWAELLSLTGMVAGMFPTMAFLMGKLGVMSGWNPVFWLVMSISILVGSIVTYPINWWMVKKGMKHGMGSSHVLGHGGASHREVEHRHPEHA